MADKSNIEWTDATWNAIRGCSRCSPGCFHCYAEVTGGRFCGPGLPYEGLIRITSSGPHWTGKVSVIEKHLEDPVRWHRPRMIFVNSMSDLFHENLGDMDIALLYSVMLAADWHIYQTLTKRADRKAEWFRKYTPADCYVAAQTECNVHPASDPFKTAALLRIKDHKGTFPKSWSEVRHIWDGVSMENQEWADKRMAHHLSTPLPMHWVSAEPLLGPINLDVFLSKLNWGEGPKEWPDGLGALNWVVVGGESGTGRVPAKWTGCARS
jgi:protein gp37